MKPIKQEDLLGCGIACVAFLIKKSYTETVQLFPDGKKKAGIRGFFCKELITVLKSTGLSYGLGYAKGDRLRSLLQPGTIIFLKQSAECPGGHYLVRGQHQWMDSWINYPELPIQAGFRDELPGKPQYILYPLALV